MQYKALSLLQPWASLVVMGAKQIETRSWNTKHRGLLLIHASAGRKKAGREICEHPRWGPIATECDWYAPDNFGAIIGCVNLVETEHTGRMQFDGLIASGQHSFRLTPQERAFGDYSPGRYGWLLSDPVMFETPIPCKGSLGLWTPDEETAKLVAKALAVKSIQ